MRIPAKDVLALLHTGVHLVLRLMDGIDMVDIGGNGVPGQHLDLGQAGASLTDGSANAVTAGVAAADHDHLLVLGKGGLVAIQHGLGAGGQVLHGGQNAAHMLCTLQLEGAGVAGADTQDNGVIALHDLVGVVGIHGRAELEGDAALLHGLDLAGDHALFQLHVGDAVLQQTTGAVSPLIDRNGKALVRQALGSGQTAGTGADDGHTLAVGGRGGVRLSGTVVLLDDKALQTADADGLAADAAGAVGLALLLLGAHTGAHLGQHGGRANELIGALIVVRAHSGNKVRDRHTGGTGLLAPVGGALQAAAGFVQGLLFGIGGVHLVKGGDALFHAQTPVCGAAGVHIGIRHRGKDTVIRQKHGALLLLSCACCRCNPRR